MKLAFYQVLHVASMVLLTAFVFQAFANPDQKNRKKTMCGIGVFAVMMLIGGFGLVATMKVGFPAWVIIKLICWLGLISISGMAYRKPEKIPSSGRGHSADFDRHFDGLFPAGYRRRLRVNTAGWRLKVKAEN